MAAFHMCVHVSNTAFYMGSTYSMHVFHMQLTFDVYVFSMTSIRIQYELYMNVALLYYICN